MATYDPNNRPDPGKTMRTIFGIFMVLVYVGVGVLFFINFFQLDAAWQWFRYVAGTILVLYGFWRGYRQFKGIQ